VRHCWPLRASALVLLCALAFIAAPRIVSAETISIVALGDSLTAGYGLPAGASFPERLEAALKARGHDVAIVNAGVSGDTASGGLSRLDWAVDPAADAVIVELGANDALRGVDPAVTRAALDEILTRLNARELPVLFAGMRAPPNMGGEYETAFNAIYGDLADAHNVLFYPFFLDGVAAEADLNLADGMHPNEAGIAVIFERIAPMVEELIARVGDQSVDG